MKEKTSITLSKDLLVQLDRVAGQEYSRSALIERVLRNYLRARARAAIDAQDLERINKAADRLNSEALEILGFQAPME